METWWVDKEHLRSDTEMSAGLPVGYTPVVKLADVEALERRVKWLEKGKGMLVQADISNQPDLQHMLEQWLAAEPGRD